MTKDEKTGFPKPLKIVIIVLIILGVLRVLIKIGLVGFLLIGSIKSKPEVYEDISRYREYMSFGTGSSDTKWNKWGMDEAIWPGEITDTMQISDFRMIYYDPWDKQYLGYLVIDYPEEEYRRETNRLREYPSTEYVGYYDVKEESTYELLAVNADPYHGFVYALTDGQKRIIYAEQIFCNYFMDLDYKKYIPESYLLDGFDASSGNPYQKRMMKK